MNRKKSKNYKVLYTNLKTVDTFVIIAATSTITLSFAGFGLILVTISTGIACGLTLTSEALY